MYDEKHPSFSGRPLDVDSSDYAPSKLERFGKWLIGIPADCDPVREKTMRQARRNHEAALLAASAMRDIAALSELEARAALISPEGKERYRKLTDAYTEAAAKAVRKKCGSR